MKAALLSLLLAGCAIPFPESMYQWERTHNPLPFTWHQVPQEAVQAYCSGTRGHAVACAYWIEGDHCWIFTAYTNLPERTRRHEEKHCAGYNHQIL